MYRSKPFLMARESWEKQGGRALFSLRKYCPPVNCNCVSQVDGRCHYAKKINAGNFSVRDCYYMISSLTVPCK